MEKFKTLEIVRASPGSAVFHLRLNRPSSGNALSLDSFAELPLALSSLDRNADALSPQDAVTAIERCRKPVIAAVHGACVGGGVDVATACDVRYCTEDAFFSVKEVDLAIIADLGTLQRLPSIVGYGNAMELALTGRRVSGSEAKELGLVSRVFGSKRELDDGVRVIAEAIASKSPMAVTGTKAVLLKSRDMSIDQGLDYVCLTLFLGMDFN
ncbi:hypothetical protein ACJRO7_033173 [Eucalyptus globulus]|uniref:Uncharacterized protein n=1 Tax=Eucalyptus globulus TaxID=34317 RepID=A0ABD3JNH7_EUCGL